METSYVQSPFYSCVRQARAKFRLLARGSFSRALVFRGNHQNKSKARTISTVYLVFRVSSLPASFRFTVLAPILLIFTIHRFLGKQTEFILKSQFHLERLLVRYFLCKIAVKFNFRRLVRFFF